MSDDLRAATATELSEALDVGWVMGFFDDEGV